MRARVPLVVLLAMSAASACSSATQFSGTVVTRNASPVNVAVYETLGLERSGPSIPQLAPRDVKLAMLGTMRAPDTVRICRSYAENWKPAGDSNATYAVLPLSRPPGNGKGGADLLLTFTPERRWVAAWSAK